MSETPTGTPPPDNPTTEPEAAPEKTGSGRYAAYDTTYLKYVGGVPDTKGAARDAAKAKGVKAGDIRIDEV